MKLLSLIIFIVIVGGVGYYIYSNPNIITEKIPELIGQIDSSNNVNPQLNSFVKNIGGNMINVDENNDQVLIKFNYPSIIGLNTAVYDVAIEAYNIFNKPLRIEGYYNNEPILALQTNNPNDKNDLLFEDIRQPEYMIETDIGIFDVLVDKVEIINNAAIIKLEYYGGEEDFADDFAGISFVAITDIPWLESITINYVKPGMCFKVKTTTNNVLKYYNDELSAESFMANLDTESCVNNVSSNNIINKNSDDVNLCSTTLSEAYQDYINANDTLQYYMSRGQGDVPEAQDAYAKYKFYKDCYEAISS